MKSNKIVYIGFLLCFLLFLSACALGKKEKSTDNNWENEILLAQECGEDGLACCADKDPACKYGSCCVDPNNPKNNYCSESCDFGKLDTFCDVANTCADGMACEKGFCKTCGGPDQPCCSDKKCSDALACFRGTCVVCGLTDNPCCAQAPYCQTSGSEGLDRAECKQEICTACGANGNPPCDKEPICNKNNLFNNNTCYRCGGFNQPCCQNITATGTEKYCSEKDLNCRLDFCSK